MRTGPGLLRRAAEPVLMNSRYKSYIHVVNPELREYQVRGVD